MLRHFNIPRLDQYTLVKLGYRELSWLELICIWVDSKSSELNWVGQSTYPDLNIISRLNIISDSATIHRFDDTTIHRFDYITIHRFEYITIHRFGYITMHISEQVITNTISRFACSTTSSEIMIPIKLPYPRRRYAWSSFQTYVNNNNRIHCPTERLPTPHTLSKVSVA